MNIYLLVILVILISNYILNLTVGFLNVKRLKTDLPEEFIGYYDADRYEKSQNYLKENTKFGIIHEGFFLFVLLLLILNGGFNAIDNIARGIDFPEIITGLVYAGMLLLFFQIIEIPFSAYDTFVIEEKYGFNKTTAKTFILDILKGWLLTAVAGGIVFSLVIWFFAKTGLFAWVWCWIAVTIFELFLIFIAPVLILPIFNKFTPLEEGDLKQSIHKYAESQNFKLKGLFTMDGSRRSSKSNAFFTGFGKYRRIVLFDTLIRKHSIDEVVSILAHEMGHYKKKHILKSIIISIFTNGLMFYILSLFIKNPGLFAAFKMDKLSIYASFFFFGFLYAPINMVFSILTNLFSRKNEYEADSYAVLTYFKPEAFILALKKLTVDNLSNLSPHPLKIFLSYSHPPVVQRIRAIRQVAH